MTAQTFMDRLTEEQRFLVRQSMTDMDKDYDREMKMIREGSDHHSTRGSAHYALGLLIRQAAGDLERAAEVIDKVLDMQFDCPDEIYHGTFRTAPEALHPPAGNLPWKSFAPGFAYFLDSTLEKISAALIRNLSLELEGIDSKGLKASFESAVDQVLPRVWNSYDPNWREFIASTFAVILEHFEDILPEELVKRMDESMVKAVTGSIDRRLSDAIPMNTNIELMHVFIAHYFGYRYKSEQWLTHAEREASKILAAYQEFGSFAEFNSTTYYGVDLTVLGLWRKYGKSETIRRIGHELEKGLWENISLFYNPNLENMSGPSARAYEMEMRGHSSIGVFLYLALGQGYEYLAGINCESGHDPMIALVGVDVPEPVKPALAVHQADRRVEKKFRELCERDKPGENSNLCTAAAWIGSDIMIGAMSGSRNTNGQLHPATIHWKTGDGRKYYLRLIRRKPGEDWNTHLRGITYDAKADKDMLVVDVHFDTHNEIELYFEILGENVKAQSIMPDIWVLPGLTCRVDADAPAPSVIQPDNGVEVVYRYIPGVTGDRMRFRLRLGIEHGQD